MKRFCTTAVAWLVAACLAPLAHAQIVTAYRIEHRPVLVPVEVTTYRVEEQTLLRPQTVTTYKQVVETSQQVQRYTVLRPLVETQYRDESHVVLEPQVAYRTVQQDQGQWEDHQIVRPGPVTAQLSLMPPSCVVDPATGVSVYQPGGLVWRPVQQPATVEVQRVWRPNLVQLQVPETVLVQKVVTQRVPVQVQRLVSEEHQQIVPVQVLKTVAEQQVIQVPEVSRRLVPVKETRYVQQLQRVYVPVDPCTGLPLATAATTLQQPAIVERPAETPTGPGQPKSPQPPQAEEEPVPPPQLDPNEPTPPAPNNGDEPQNGQPPDGARAGNPMALMTCEPWIIPPYISFPSAAG